jgi:hypothetical protein
MLTGMTGISGSPICQQKYKILKWSKEQEEEEEEEDH